MRVTKSYEKPKMAEMELKVTLIGDEGTGKSSIGACYKEGKLSGSLPVIIPTFAKEEYINSTKVTIVLWDCACSPEYDDIRIRGYSGTSHFVVCFALDDLKSLKRAERVWAKEAAQHAPDATVVLVGTKVEVRTVAERDIAPFRARMKPRHYAEISTKSGQGINELFNTIALLAVDADKVPIPGAQSEAADDGASGKADGDGDEAKKAETAKTGRPNGSSTCLLL